eukprot:scaffold109674_cov48-Phaeocystis_antarctica.AAC.1
MDCSLLLLCSCSCSCSSFVGGRRTQIAGCGGDSRHRLSLGHGKRTCARVKSTSKDALLDAVA